MVPVRKPGRPLSTCPCPPGRPCACGGVRVAIPKKQKCGCPPDGDKESEEHERDHSPVEPPMSPSRPAFRVGKPNGGTKANGRKQSFDPANLERMDPRSINLMAAAGSNGATNGTTNGAPNGIAVAGSPVLPGTPADLTGFRPGMRAGPAGPDNAFPSPPNPNFVSPMPYGMGFPYPQPTQLQHGIKLENGLYMSPNGSVPPSPYTNGNHAPPPLGSPAQPVIPIPKTNGSTSGGGSCCGRNTQKSAPAPAPAPAPNNPPAPVPVYSQPYMAHFPYPTVFRYPGDYGSWQHPIDPVIWQQVVSQTGVPLGTPMSPTTKGDAVDNGTSHQCNCGEGCQCVGCLAHPFNPQMFQYVNNAYNGSNGSSPGGADQPAGGQTRGAVTAGQESPTEAPTPAASEGSPAREEQSLSTMDYFFVNLPISGLCGGHLESCPCGDSCDCPGCLVHNIPLNQG